MWAYIHAAALLHVTCVYRFFYLHDCIKNVSAEIMSVLLCILGLYQNAYIAGRYIAIGA